MGLQDNLNILYSILKINKFSNYISHFMIFEQKKIKTFVKYHLIYFQKSLFKSLT